MRLIVVDEIGYVIQRHTLPCLRRVQRHEVVIVDRFGLAGAAPHLPLSSCIHPHVLALSVV